MILKKGLLRHPGCCWTLLLLWSSREQCCALSCLCVGLWLQLYSPPESSSGKLRFDLENLPITEQWKRCVTEKLNSISEVFATDDLTYGHTTAVKHHIRLQDDTPFKERSRPIYPCAREAIKQHLRELLDAGIIRESESPFASPIVVVRKKNGTIRLRVDYRKLNTRTLSQTSRRPSLL